MGKIIENEKTPIVVKRTCCASVRKRKKHTSTVKKKPKPRCAIKLEKKFDNCI